MCRSIQVEGVVCTNDQVNLASKVVADRLPIGVEIFDDVVVASPVVGHLRIDIAGCTAKHLFGPAVCIAWREDPLKGCKLATVFSHHIFKLCELLHGGARLSMGANDRGWLAI